MGLQDTPAPDTASLVVQVVAMLNGRHWDRIASLYHEDVVLHAPLAKQPGRGRAAVQALYEEQAAAVPDLRLDVVEMVVEGDRAAVRGSLSGTHRGRLAGFPASGRAFDDVDACAWYRAKDGRIAELWVLPTNADILERVGLVPSGPPPRLLVWLLGLKMKLQGGTAAAARPSPQPPVHVERRPGEPGELQKFLVRKGLLEFFGARRFELWDEVFDPAYQIISKLDDVSGKAATAKHYKKVTATFPDLYFSIEDILAQGDRVGVLVTARGTHLGPLEGFPATGKRYEATEFFIFTVPGERVLRQWHFVNFEAILQQVGLAPPGPPPLPMRLLMRLLATPKPPR